MRSMLSQMGSFPLEEHGCRVPSPMSQRGAFPLEEQMGSFPLEESERVPSSWSSSMRSDLEAVDPKPASQNVSFKNEIKGLDGDVEWQIVDSEPKEISSGAMVEIDGG